MNKKLSITIRDVFADELDLSLFSHFNRYQKVSRCWRYENGEWILRDIAFAEQWGKKEYAFLVECLKNTLADGGAVVGAFENNTLIGFASVENKPFGAHNEYLQLSSIHVSFKQRGCGIGRRLFHIACEKAKALGAKKLYISAHSSEESQAFYKSLGCTEAVEYNEKLVAAEPCDCQLEYIL